VAGLLTLFSLEAFPNLLSVAYHPSISEYLQLRV